MGRTGSDIMDASESSRGLLLNYTGDGKGKSSAAFGTALRALGWGWKVGILQFIKDDAPTGEAQFFRRYFPELIFEQYGAGMLDRDADHRGAAEAGWKRAQELLQTFDGELLIFDELNVVLHFYLLEPDDIRAALLARRPGLNVILTGRYAHPKIIEISDLVTRVECEKHPFEQGLPARRGIDF